MDSQQTNPNIMPNLRIPRFAYVAVWLIAAIVALLFEDDVLPAGFLSSSTAGVKYAVSLACVALTLVGTWGGLRIFTMKSVRRKLFKHPCALMKYNLIRTGIFSVMIAFNLLAYYAYFEPSQLYCLLVSLVGFIFCWPKQEEGQ